MKREVIRNIGPKRLTFEVVLQKGESAHVENLGSSRSFTMIEREETPERLAGLSIDAASAPATLQMILEIDDCVLADSEDGRFIRLERVHVLLVESHDHNETIRGRS